MNYTVAGRACGSGPDVAMYQPGTNFTAAFVTEDFAFIKATEGIGYLDPWWTRHAAAANQGGKPWGPYHFARPANDPIREADWFCQIILATPGWAMPPVLDMEQPGTGAWVIAFCERVTARTGRKPLIYTGAYVAYDRPDGLLAYDLWIAAYNAGYAPDPNPETIGEPPSCRPWGRNWSAWQYTSSATVNGVPGRCDRSVADRAWLDRVTGPPTPPEPDVLDQADKDFIVNEIRNAVRPVVLETPSGKYLWDRGLPVPAGDVQVQMVANLIGAPNAYSVNDEFVGQLRAGIGCVGGGAGADAAAIAAAVVDQLGDDLARQVSDEIAARLAN